jgi:hypothetical protein
VTLSLEFTNWREREQAQNLCHLLAAVPAEPLGAQASPPLCNRTGVDALVVSTDNTLT